jgi:hypothetical protein
MHFRWLMAAQELLLLLLLLNGLSGKLPNS